MAKIVKQLSPVAAAYLAGLLDGEGTITLTRKHKGENRQIVVSIANTERKLLEWALSAVGAGRITAKRAYSDKHRSSYAYQIANTQALQLLSQVLPYLHSYKRLRAQLALEKYQALTPRNGRYSPKLLAEREKFIQEFLAITSKGRAAQ